MRVLALLASLVLLCLPSGALAQIAINIGTPTPRVCTTTTLNSGTTCAPRNPHNLAVVTNGASTVDCTVGGGSTRNWCEWNPVTLLWQDFVPGGAGGGGGTTVTVGGGGGLAAANFADSAQLDFSEAAGNVTAVVLSNSITSAMIPDTGAGGALVDADIPGTLSLSGGTISGMAITLDAGNPAVPTATARIQLDLATMRLAYGDGTATRLVRSLQETDTEAELEGTLSGAPNLHSSADSEIALTNSGVNGALRYDSTSTFCTGAPCNCWFEDDDNSNTINGVEVCLNALTGGGGTGHTIQEGTTSLAARTNLRFGSNEFSLTDNSGANATEVDIAHIRTLADFNFDCMGLDADSDGGIEAIWYCTKFNGAPGTTYFTGHPLQRPSEGMTIVHGYVRAVGPSSNLRPLCAVASDITQFAANDTAGYRLTNFVKSVADAYVGVDTRLDPADSAGNNPQPIRAENVCIELPSWRSGTGPRIAMTCDHDANGGTAEIDCSLKFGEMFDQNFTADSNGDNWDTSNINGLTIDATAMPAFRVQGTQADANVTPSQAVTITAASRYGGSGEACTAAGTPFPCCTGSGAGTCESSTGAGSRTAAYLVTLASIPATVTEGDQLYLTGTGTNSEPNVMYLIAAVNRDASTISSIPGNTLQIAHPWEGTQSVTGASTQPGTIRTGKAVEFNALGIKILGRLTFGNVLSTTVGGSRTAPATFIRVRGGGEIYRIEQTISHPNDVGMAVVMGDWSIGGSDLQVVGGNISWATHTSNTKAVCDDNAWARENGVRCGSGASFAVLAPGVAFHSEGLATGVHPLRQLVAGNAGSVFRYDAGAWGEDSRVIAWAPGGVGAGAELTQRYPEQDYDGDCEVTPTPWIKVGTRLAPANGTSPHIDGVGLPTRVDGPSTGPMDGAGWSSLRLHVPYAFFYDAVSGCIPDVNKRKRTLSFFSGGAALDLDMTLKHTGLAAETFDLDPLTVVSGRVRVISPMVNAKCTASVTPDTCCTGFGTGTCQTTNAKPPSGQFSGLIVEEALSSPFESTTIAQYTSGTVEATTLTESGAQVPSMATSASVDGELTLFSSTGGQTIRRSDYADSCIAANDPTEGCTDLDQGTGLTPRIDASGSLLGTTGLTPLRRRSTGSGATFREKILSCTGSNPATCQDIILTIDDDVLQNRTLKLQTDGAATGNYLLDSGDIGAGLAFAGGILATANISGTAIQNDAITYAKLQNVTTNQRLIGLSTGAPADPAELSISTALDWLGATQGQVLYRGASGWVVLAVGTSGQLLTSGGAAANVSWSDPPGASADSISVEDGDNGGTFTAVTNTARFEDSGDINFVGTGDNPKDISGEIRTGAVGTAEVAADSLAAGDLAPDSCAASEIAANAVGVSELDFVPQIMEFDAASCIGGVATRNWDDIDTLAEPAAACVNGAGTPTFTVKGVADFDDSVDQGIMRSILLPSSGINSGDWTGAIDLQLIWFGTGTTGNVDWTVQTGCTAIGQVDDPGQAFHAEQSFPDAAAGTANQLNSAVQAGLTVTNCAAGEIMYIRVFRDANDATNDTTTGPARLVKAVVTLRIAY